MNKLLEVQRDTADLSPLEKQREIVIQRLMISYNLDRTTAAQTYETMSYNAARFTWGKSPSLILRYGFRSHRLPLRQTCLPAL